MLGILAVTSEWSQRTGLVTFTLEPSRRRIVYAKLTAIVITGVAFVVLVLGLAAIANVIGMAVFDGDGSWTFGIEGIRDVLLLQLMGLLQGVAFGMILMNSAAAIVTAFVLPTAFSVVANIVPKIQDAAPWIDLGTAQGPLFDHTMAGDEWAHARPHVAVVDRHPARGRRLAPAPQRGEVARSPSTGPGLSAGRGLGASRPFWMLSGGVGEGLLEHRQRLVDQGVVDHQRRQEPEHVAVGAARQGEHSLPRGRPC